MTWTRDPGAFLPPSGQTALQFSALLLSRVVKFLTALQTLAEAACVEESLPCTPKRVLSAAAR